MDMVTWAEEGWAVPTGTLGKRLWKARPGVPPSWVTIPAFPGEAEIGGPKSGLLWNLPQALKPLRAFEGTGSVSALG